MSLEVLQHAEAWRRAGRAAAMATVVRTGGSSPRPLGSKLVIDEDLAFAGSVSGGCIEGAVLEEARAVLDTGKPKLARYGIADEEAWAVGLSCGGTIEVLIERLPQVAETDWFSALIRALEQEEALRLAVVLESEDQEAVGYRWSGSASGAENKPLDAVIGALEPGTHEIELDQRSHQVFVEQIDPPSTLVIVGAVHIAEHLVHFAQRLGFRCVVTDARETFASKERFGHANQLLIGWPQEVLEGLPLRPTTYVAVLTHDPKLDDPALAAALQARARYIGALGSKRTHGQRLERLRSQGFEDQALERIDAPIGLPLGGRRPEEIALSIAARLVEVRSQKGANERSDHR